MKTIATDSMNNLVFVDGNLQVIDKGASVLQAVRNRLAMYQGEWFLDKNAGTPWFQQIFVKPINLSVVESIIKARVLDTDGVLRITKFSLGDFNATNRNITISFEAETIYGLINNNDVYINI